MKRCNTVCSSCRLQLFCSYCSLKFCNIHRKTSVLVSLFNDVVGLEACNFIKKWLQHRCLPVSIAKFLKNSFFYKKPSVAVLMSAQERKEKCERKRRETFQMKEKKKMKTFHLTNICKFWC